MSFANRIVPAEAWERTVEESIRRRGWTVAPFGQALLTPELRDQIKVTPTPIRWMADLLAVRGDRVLFVDAKTGRTDTSNHDLEKAALDAYRRCHDAWGIDTVVVWNDRMHNGRPAVALASMIKDEWLQTMHGTAEARLAGRGSGTPAWLIPKTLSFDFDVVFSDRCMCGDADPGPGALFCPGCEPFDQG